MPSSTLRSSISPSNRSTLTPGAKAATLPSAERMTAGMRFIGGAPMNVATKVVAGSSYTSVGVPICSRRPALSTAMRVAMVMASTWSWVT